MTPKTCAAGYYPLEDGVVGQICVSRGESNILRRKQSSQAFQRRSLYAMYAVNWPAPAEYNACAPQSSTEVS